MCVDYKNYLNLHANNIISKLSTITFYTNKRYSYQTENYTEILGYTLIVSLREKSSAWHLGESLWGNSACTEAKAKRDSSGLIGAWNAGRSVRALRTFHPRRAFKVAHGRKRTQHAFFFIVQHIACWWKHHVALCSYIDFHMLNCFSYFDLHKASNNVRRCVHIRWRMENSLTSMGLWKKKSMRT